MEEYIKTFTIRKFSGENVTDACVRIKAIARSLGTNRLPSDIIHRVLEGFAQASTPTFQSFFHYQESMITSSLMKSNMNNFPLYKQLVNILTDLEVKYTDLRSGQRWLGLGNDASVTNSVFTSHFDHTPAIDNDEEDSTDEYIAYIGRVGRSKALPYDVWVRDKTCFKCQGIGHVAKYCPNPPAPPSSTQAAQQTYRTNRSTANHKRDPHEPNHHHGRSYTKPSKQTDEKRSYSKAVLTAALELIDICDQKEDSAENGIDSDPNPSSPPTNQDTNSSNASKYSTFLAALGCPKE